MQKTQRSRLMRMSWQIQKRRGKNRSQSLAAAWAIFLNEDITVYHLAQKHGGFRSTSPNLGSFTLFNR
jgi:hypothetical protein